ncbi:MAG: DinB family protein [Janthinobacterium lividum]
MAEESHPENALYATNLCGHLRGMVHRMRQLPADKHDWTFAPPAPTPRILANHTWQWLVCDRQHIEEPDAAKHTLIPESPADFGLLCDALAKETDRWEQMILALTPDQLDSMRSQFNDYPMTVRDFLGHMLQNCIYKHGQFSTLYFALGLDGDIPYDAPFPNPFYAELHEGREDAL